MRYPSTAPHDANAQDLRAFLECQERVMAPHQHQGRLASYRYGSPAALMLDRGTFWASEPLTPAEAKLVRRAIFACPDYPLVPKRCYSNCQQIIEADRSGELAYCEGYVLSAIPIGYAWLDLHGKLIDPTLVVDASEAGYATLSQVTDLRKRAAGLFPMTRAYLGLRFTDRAAIRAHNRANADNITLIDDWQHDWPLLTGEPLYGLDDATLVEV